MLRVEDIAVDIKFLVDSAAPSGVRQHIILPRTQPNE